MSLDERLWRGKTPQNTELIPFSWRDIRKADHWDDQTEDIRPARHITTGGWILYDGLDPDEPSAEIVVLGNHYDWEEERWAEFHCFPKHVVRKQ